MTTEQILAEIGAVRSQIEVLREERTSLSVNVTLPENDSPQAIADAYRRYARENSQLVAELKE